jgi:hypothetical protein
MRKDQPEREEDITTADLAQGKPPATSEGRPKPALAGPPGESAQSVSSEARNASEAAPLFPNNELEELRNRWSGVQTAFVDEPVAPSSKRTVWSPPP